MAEKKVDVGKVKDWHMNGLSWYRILMMFVDNTWVNRDHIEYLTGYSPSSATLHLRNKGFSFKRRNHFVDGVDGQKIKVVQLAIDNIPEEFRKD